MREGAAREAPGLPGGSAARHAPGEGAADGGRWASLSLVSLAVLLGMTGWFAAAAVAPELGPRWGMDPARVGWLTVLVQLGFVAGTATAATLNLADLVPSRRYFAACSLLAAGANAALLVAPGLASALLTRFLTGFFLAGVYPPSMKMIATWFRSARGLAIGTVVGALTVGKASPYLLNVLGGADPTVVVLGSSAAGVLAAALVFALYRDGPWSFQRRPFSWALVGSILRHRKTMLATGGYLGHMWELYAGWAGLSLFFADVFLGKGAGEVAALSLAALAAFAAIAMGGPGSLLAGVWADRLGRENVACAAMAVSGACALLIGWLMAAPTWVVVAVALLWGFAIVADSAQFSALVTEVSPQHAVGTALTLQTSMGFLLSAVTIWLMIEVETRMGWGVAFSMLAIGPVLGIVQMLVLRSERVRGDA